MTRFLLPFALGALALTACQPGTYEATDIDLIQSPPLSPVDLALQDWPESLHSAARAVISCESNDNPNAVGGAAERGLFQVHPIHFRQGGLGLHWGFTWSEMFDPMKNGQMAWRLFSHSHNGRQNRWTPWTCARIVGVS